MAEYIEREKVINLLKKYGIKRGNKVYGIADIGDVMISVEDIPAADVALVRHGVWEYEPPTINTYGMLKCSKCGWWTLDQSVCDVYHYCPNCGCKMDLEG